MSVKTFSKCFTFIAALTKSFSCLLFPPICLHCRRELQASHYILCRDCMGQMEVIDPLNRFPCCFAEDLQEEGGFCRQCSLQAQFICRIASVFDYEEAAAAVVREMKYGAFPHLAKGAGAFMALQFLRLKWPMPDYIVPMPMARLRLWERGYNQSDLLAQSIGKILSRPVIHALGRKSGDFCQAGMSYQQRMRLGSDSFYLKKSPDLRDKVILLVDDVLTTGSSLRRCGEVLAESYPEAVYGLTFCRA